MDLLASEEAFHRVERGIGEVVSPAIEIVEEAVKVLGQFFLQKTQNGIDSFLSHLFVEVEDFRELVLEFFHDLTKGGS